MEWLADQEKKGILETQIRPTARTIAVDQRWTDVYVRSAYQKGIARGRAELRKANYPVASFTETPGGLSTVFNQPFHADRVGALYTRTFNELKGITAAMDQQISRVLAQGLVEGMNPRPLAKLLADRVNKIGITRARVLARTEVVRAHHAASVAEYRQAGVEGVSVQVEWLTAGYNVCPICEALEGNIYSLDEIEGMIPRHPNCLPENSRVSAQGITAASKRWYDGDLIIISTATGKKLACTPNHPIFTRRGWVPARSVNIGSDIICGNFSDRSSTKSGCNHNVPTPIKEITEALRSSRQVTTSKVPVSSPDFHGDGKAGDIAVIWTDSKLLNNIRNSAFSKPYAKQMFCGRHIGDMLFSMFSPANQFGHSTLRTANRFMSSFCLEHFFSNSHLLPFELFGFASRPWTEAVFMQDTVYDVSGGSKLLAKSISRETFFEQITNFIFGQTKSSAIGRSKSGLLENAFDNFMCNTEFPGYRSSSFPGNIFIDNVVSVGHQFFSGHVYNLETENGFYFADGILCHNCRCTAIPAAVGERESERGR
jgi:SPP1 gp7 family putative phage head morphogenesis protein